MVKWRYSHELISYEEALGQMAQDVESIQSGGEEVVWCLEHPPIYTAGTSSNDRDLKNPRFPVYETGRGGQYTYHGPGQRVVYVMLDLNKRGKDIRKFVASLEKWVIAVLAEFNVKGMVREGRVGVWVERTGKPQLFDGSPAEDKIAAIGIRLSKWVSFHGISINVEPDLEHFDGIVPCGITDYGVTSLADLGHMVTLSEVDMVLRDQFERVFANDLPI